MDWKDVESEYPDCDEIECMIRDTIETFTARLVESKWGNVYRDKDGNALDFTHWRKIE